MVQPPLDDKDTEPPPAKLYTPNYVDNLTIILLRTSDKGEPIAFIIEEDSENKPRILQDDELNTLSTTLHSELIAGMQRWIETLNELGTFNTNNTMSDSPSVNWSSVEKELKRGAYSSAHVILTLGQTETMTGFMEKILVPLYFHRKKGGLLSIENQITSNLWSTKWFKKFADDGDMHCSVTDKCCWGLGLQHRTRICTNIPESFMKEVQRANVNVANPI